MSPVPKGKGWWWPCCSDPLQVLRAKGERQQLLQPLDNVGAICFGQVDIPVCAKLEERRNKNLMRDKKGRSCISSPNYSYASFFRFTGSIPLYCMHFGLAYQYFLPQRIFWAQILCFYCTSVSPGTSEPVESDPRAEPRNPLNINNPKKGCGCWEEGGRAGQDLWEAQLLQENPHFQAYQSQSKDSRAKPCTWRNKPPEKGELMDSH